MLENAMPGEAFLFNGIPADGHHHVNQQAAAAAVQNGLPKNTLQDMAEKLQKSEIGRKKLRQAISMLKEKVEANEKVLQVNEILRQECEKERLRAEAERNRAEEEKNRREEVEKEGLSLKEQLVRVLQRVDALERNWKTDHNEIEQMRKEMNQAISGLGGAVKAIEAAHSSFETLEKGLLGKVSNAVGASTKSTSLAETAISDAKGALATADAAEKLSESLVSKVSVLQKQGASLDERVTLLQQELTKRQLDPIGKEPKGNTKLASDGTSLAPDKPTRGMVLSKNQQQACKRLTSPTTVHSGCSPEGTAFGPRLTRPEILSSVIDGAKPAGRHSLGTGVCPKRRKDRKGSEITTIESFGAGHSSYKALSDLSSPQVDCQAGLDKSVLDSSTESIVRKALDAAKEKRKLQQTAPLNKVILQPGKSSSCLRNRVVTARYGTHGPKEYPVSGEEFKGRLQLDSSNGSMPALLENEKNSSASHFREVSRGTNLEDLSVRRPGIKSMIPKAPDDAGAVIKVISAKSLLPEEKTSESLKSGSKLGRNGHKGEKLSAALLTDITKLFLKEKKTREKMEQKLASLQKLLQYTEHDEFPKQGLVDARAENCVKRKRKRRESMMERDNVRVCVRDVEEAPVVKSNEDHSFLSPGEWVGGKVIRAALDVGTSNKKDNVISTGEDATGPVQSHKSCPSDSDASLKSRGDLTKLQGPQISDLGHSALQLDSLAALPNANEPRKEMSVNTEMSEMSGGWDSDSESSEDEMGEGWWTEERVLLSPSLPIIMPPSRLEGPHSNAPLPWATVSDMNLEDISLFLDILPPIDQVRDEDRAVESFSDGPPLQSKTQELYLESILTAPEGQRTKEIQRGLAKELSLDVLPPINLVRDEDRAVATLPYSAPSESKSAEVDIESVKTPRDEERSKESQGGLATETNGDLHICRKVKCFEDGCRPSDSPGSFVESDGKKGWIAGSSFFNNSSRSGLREPYFSPLDVNIVSLRKIEGLDDELMATSELRGTNVLRDSNDAVKDEKVDATVLLKTKFPYSVELVVGGLAQEGWMNCSWRVMQQGSRGSTTDVSSNIMEAFGRTTGILQRALKHSSNDAFGSSLAISSEITSFFGSSTLSKPDLLCIFTASLVDLHALWENGKTSSCLGVDCKSLQLLIDIVKQVLAGQVFQNSSAPDQASLLFAVQLQSFLIQGTLQPVSRRISVEPRKEGSAMEQCFYFATPNLKLKRVIALISGGKLLAMFCKTVGKLDFLRNTVYNVLRFCDMDNECLLAIISSLACESLFSLDKDGIVSKAVQVVISELIHDTDLGSPANVKETESRIQQGSYNAPDGSADGTLLLVNRRALREVISEDQTLSFENFVPRLVELFYAVITATPDSHLMGNRHLFQRSLRKITCYKIIEPNSPADAECLVKFEQSVMTSRLPDVTSAGFDESAAQIGKNDYDDIPIEVYCWRDVTDKMLIQPVSQSDQDVHLREEWEQKFYDITNAVELVASHLGWEWTYNDFITEHLWKLVSPRAPSLTVACVAYMFGLLGRLGMEVGSTELPGVDELRKCLLVVLSLDQTSDSSNGGHMHNFSFKAQVAAAQSLLVLSSSSRKDEVFPTKDPERASSKVSELHAKSVKSLWNWVQALKPEIENILPSSLRDALLSINMNNFVPIF